MKYSQPTPVPEGYTAPAIGQAIDMEKEIEMNEKPVFLHFFNPNCPCSRFNFDHFRKLVNTYSDEIEFKVVLQDLDEEKARKAFADYEMDIPAMFDKEGEIAKAYGVYATPQAVLVDLQGHIYYRGNYNKSRYCTVPGSNFAQMAIDSLLTGTEVPDFSPLAYKAYGCQLPADNPETALSIWESAL